MKLDHVVIHVDGWDDTRRFYRDVLDCEEIANPEGAANPVGSWAFRLGGHQINVHGPWPGMTQPCCPPPFNRVGSSDLAFQSAASPADTVAHLRTLGVEIVAGPTKRFGAQGWGTSLYCRDPSGNGVEIIHYEAQGEPPNDLEVAEILADAMRIAISLRDASGEHADRPTTVGRSGVQLVDHLNLALQTLLEDRLRRQGLTYHSMSLFELLPLLRAAEDGSA